LDYQGFSFPGSPGKVLIFDEYLAKRVKKLQRLTKKSAKKK
jgi:hypothetical protein